jgi:periplasmic divalent cation tolerance protein
VSRRDGNVRVVLVTAPPRKARALARALVGRRLAACANLVPGVKSVYRWKGRVEEAGETLLVLKTSAARLPALAAAVRELHPYDCPEFVALRPDAVLPAYAAWVRAETK